MAQLATKEEYSPILEKLFNDATPSCRELIQVCYKNFYYYTSYEVSPKAIPVKEFEETFNEMVDKFFPKIDELNGKKSIYQYPHYWSGRTCKTTM